MSICSDKKCERLVCEKIDMVEPVLSYLNGGGDRKTGDQKTQKSRFQIRGDFVTDGFAKMFENTFLHAKMPFKQRENDICL